MLQVHRAERADALVKPLAGLLAEPLADPFSLEVIAVPARGMERWLTQQLSLHLGAAPGRQDGICAAVLFPSPAQLVADAVALATGIDPEADPWRPERSLWPLLEIVESALDEPWLAALADYLGRDGERRDPDRASRRLAIVRHLAELYHRYALHRPDLLEAWAAGRQPPDTGCSRVSSADWQAELWRRLRAAIAVSDPARRLALACEAIERNPALVQLPPRVALFGLTRMPAAQLRVLRALSAGREVHLFLLHPSPALWPRVAAAAPRDDGRTAPARDADPTAELPRNPLLRSWGRDARELQLLLHCGGPLAEHHHRLAPSLTTPAREQPTLLALLQTGVREDLAPPGAPLPGDSDRRALLDEQDRSVQVHSCHGRTRQVEVMREAILHALAEDPSLQPREVIVMCPDIERFAPLIQAAFIAEQPAVSAQQATAGAGQAAPGAEDSEARADIRLRVRLADRSPRQTNPLLGLAAELLELADGRLTASQVLDLADRGPVRRRFALDDEDLTRLRGWTAEAAVRWGLDAAHRSPFHLHNVSAGTWRAGLDRLLVGVALSGEGEQRFAGVLPLNDVDSDAIDLAGRFAELLDRLGVSLDALRAPQPLSSWATQLTRAVDALALAHPREAWQRAQLGELLEEMVGQAQGCTLALELGEVRAMLAERIAARPTRANFRTGHLTFCTLVPMRSVPHRVVCLLGLDDGAFPRRPARDGEDVLLERPRVGERDARGEDRQLLLDALMAAESRLIITFSGADERTGAPLPPAVPVAELLDAIDATARSAAGSARAQVLIHHPLQPFNPRNFIAGELIASTSWSFDELALEGARALSSPRHPRRPFLAQPLPPLHHSELELAELEQFLRHPVRAFLRERLGLSLFEPGDQLSDELTITVDSRQRWQIGQSLLGALLVGVEGRAACLAAIARGNLPPGELGRPVLEEVYRLASTICREVKALRCEPPAARDVHLELPSKRTLTGTVPDVCGETILASSFSKLSPAARLTAWVRLLALTAAEPERPWTAVTIGSGGAQAACARIRPLAGDGNERRAHALAQLELLADLRARGMREPLPLFCSSSAAFAGALARGEDPVAAARAHWSEQPAPEAHQPEHLLVLGGVRTLEEILQQPPAADERGHGWDESLESRLGRLAWRLWSELLAHEEQRRR